ncbi:MAG: helix-turn-helix transcriptional regulator [Kofleriaceae bacterium]|nr:helix-turn-helix transcriptional regulator [Myxococcales bacterium]MCB9563089.1 helix-turn-helix transcriptional regulator [Kofleriaceae bacterium]
MLPSGVPRHATPRAFAASTGDAIHVGRGVLTWRLDGLEGVTVWGRVSRVVAEAALAPLTQHAHARIPTPAAAVTDLSRVTEVEPDAYALLHDRLLRLFADVAPKLHEHVIVTPRGLLGAATVGLASATARHRWRVVPDLPAALAAVGHQALAPRIAELVARCLAEEQVLSQIRACVVVDRPVGVADVARRLGTSSRVLQRRLAALGTSFREVRDEARLHVARALLVHSDDKVEVIGASIGCATLSGFVRLFRRHHGETPTAYRRRIRGTAPYSEGR